MQADSESSSPINTSSTPKSHARLIAIVLVSSVALFIGAILGSDFLSNPQDQSDPIFKGAYAMYEGSTSLKSEDIGLFEMTMSVNFAVRQEVVDLNGTHVLLSTSFRMTSSFGDINGETVEDENSAWVPRSQMSFMSALEDFDLTKNYETTINIANFGARPCLVYEYILSNEGLAFTLYVDKEIGWPLKMTISTDENIVGLNLTLDINLTETNIPALSEFGNRGALFFFFHFNSFLAFND